MKLNFHRASRSEPQRMPLPSEIPPLQTGTLAALYRAARVGGDFFDFESVRGRLVFLLLDIAGRRDEALAIAARTQEIFHAEAKERFNEKLVNESDALSEMAIRLNREIIEAAKGVRCAPAFLGSYDEDLGTVFYVNAGHIPALLRDSTGVVRLEATGLPFGLFSHATHDAMPAVLEGGAALLLVSKGLVESKSGSQEFGMDRLQQSLEHLTFASANELCSAVLTAVEEFTKNTPGQNDITAMALMRSQAAVSLEKATVAAAVS